MTLYQSVVPDIFLFFVPSPEGLGVLAGGVYVLVMVLFIPFPFANLHFNGMPIQFSVVSLYEFAKYLAALLSILAMILLGFADDVLNLKWRYKVILPTVAVFPVLMVYYVAFGTTTVVVPLPLRPFLGRIVDLGKPNIKDLRVESIYRRIYWDLILKFSRYIILRLYVGFGGLLYEFHQYFGRNQWSRSRPILNDSHLDCYQ